MKKDQKICMIAGIAIAAVSTIAAVDLTFRKKHHKLGLLAGLAGATAGILLATHPVRKAMKTLELDDFFEDDEFDPMQERLDALFADSEKLAEEPAPNVEVKEAESVVAAPEAEEETETVEDAE